MTSRRERVVLELVDEFTPGAARAAASARLLRDSVNDIDHSSRTASPALQRTSRDTTALGQSSGRSAPEIDRLSGRLRLLTDVAVTVGPALTPIGAVGIPAITGLASSVGFAAVGLGVLVGSLQGVKDTLKVVNEAALEPTAENLQKAREAMDDLSPAGQQLVTTLHNLIPVLKGVRDAGAEGAFPGLTAGIDALERRVPLLERTFYGVGKAVGDLGQEAGESLSSGRWGPFLRFIEDEAPDAITNLGHITGDLAHGLAELWMAFDPLNDDVTGVLLRGAAAFDDFASGLDQTQGFQEFIDYIETNGPQVGETLGAVANAVLQVVEATAPLGGPVLHILETVFDAIGSLADSDIGTPLLIGVAAMAALSRATAAWGAVSRSSVGQFVAGQRTAQASITATTARVTGLGRSLGVGSVARGGALLAGIALASSGAAEGVGLSNTASLALMGTIGGPWGAVLGGGVGALLDLKSAGDGATSAIQSLDEAAASGDIDALTKRIKSAKAEYADLQNVDYSSAKDILGDLGARASMNLSGGPDAFRAAISGAEDDLEGLTNRANGAAGAAELLAPALGLTAEQLRVGADAAQSFSGALGELDGWLGKRAALRSYRDDLAGLAKGIKDGFTREDVDKLDATAGAISKVAASIKDKGIRADFLQGARASLDGLADKSGPKARAEINKVISKMDQFGLTHPKAPKLDAETKPAETKLKKVKKSFDIMAALAGGPKVDADTRKAEKALHSTDLLMSALNQRTARPKVSANVADAIGGINTVKGLIASLRNKTIFLTTVNRRVGAGGQGPGAVPVSADGGEVVGAPRHPYADKVLYMLAPGEEIISNRYGQADRFRADRAAGEIPGYADGGTTGTDDSDPKKRKPRRRPPIVVDSDDPRYNAPAGAKQRVSYFKDFEHDAEKALRKLEHSFDVASATVDANKEAVDRETSARDQLQGSFDSLQSSIAGMFQSDLFTSTNDVFGSNSATSDPISVLLSDLANSQQFDALFAGLQGQGLHGSALTAAAQGGISGLQTVGAYNSTDLSRYQSLYDQREQRSASSGQQVAQAQFGQALADQTARLDEANRIAYQNNAQLVAIEAAVRQQEKTVKQAGAAQEAATKGLGKSVAAGKRNRR